MGALVATAVNVTPFNPAYVGQFVEGYHRALHVGAAITLVGALIAVLTVRTAHHAEEPSRAAEPAVGA
jgi:hypothetical protein